MNTCVSHAWAPNGPGNNMSAIPPKDPAGCEQRRRVRRDKTTFHPFRKFVFDPTPKRRISAPSGRGHLWSQSKRIRRWKKVQKKYSRFRENRGKRFFFGVISPLTGGKLSKREVVSYMGAKLRARCSKMLILDKKFPLCYVFVHFWWRH